MTSLNPVRHVKLNVRCLSMPQVYSNAVWLFELMLQGTQPTDLSTPSYYTSTVDYDALGGDVLCMSVNDYRLNHKQHNKIRHHSSQHHLIASHERPLNGAI